jgi:hypothetical protein
MKLLSCVTIAAVIFGINGQTSAPACAVACAAAACGPTPTDLQCLCVASGAAIGQCVFANCTGTDLSAAVSFTSNCVSVPGYTPPPSPPACAVSCATSACGTNPSNLQCLCRDSTSAIGQCVAANCTGTDLSLAVSFTTYCGM